jgi:hypothetical protein
MQPSPLRCRGWVCNANGPQWLLPQREVIGSEMQGLVANILHLPALSVGHTGPVPDMLTPDISIVHALS